jgi:hypothetical protein
MRHPQWETCLGYLIRLRDAWRVLRLAERRQPLRLRLEVVTNPGAEAAGPAWRA